MRIEVQDLITKVLGHKEKSSSTPSQKRKAFLVGALNIPKKKRNPITPEKKNQLTTP